MNLPKYFPDWVYTNSKICFFLSCLCQSSLHPQYFFWHIQSCTFLKNHYWLFYFLFLVFSSFTLCIYRTVVNGSMLRQHSVLSLQNRSLDICILFFNSSQSVNLPRLIFKRCLDFLVKMTAIHRKIIYRKGGALIFICNVWVLLQ